MGFLFRLVRSVVLRALWPSLLVSAGWYGGAKYGAPDSLVKTADAVVQRVQTLAAPLIGRGGEIAAEAVEQGGEYIVGTVEQTLEDTEDSEDTEDAGETGGEAATKGAPARPTEDGAAKWQIPAGEGAIVLCPKMRVSNRPDADAGGLVRKAGAVVFYRDVELLLMPATNACLSSGYGDRGGKLHRGVDYYTKTGGDVLGAGDGVIVEAVSRSDYGNMIVIDHGMGVYTRYAHLASFDRGVRKGASVVQGQVLGPIGKTGASNIVHLHWEILSGDIDTNAGSFGLKSIDPFSL